MSMSDVEIRPSTAEDIMEFFGKQLGPTVRAWSVFWKGKLTAIAGTTIEQGGMIAFSDVREHDAPKLLAWRTIKKVASKMLETNATLFASPKDNCASARRILSALGFYDTGKKQGDKPIWARIG